MANNTQLEIEDLFNKVYPYPVASRISQQLIAEHYEKNMLTSLVKKGLKPAFRIKGLFLKHDSTKEAATLLQVAASLFLC